MPPNVGQLIASSWPNLITDKPEDQIFKDRWLFNRLTTKNGGLKKVNGGSKIEISIQYATNTTFRSYSDMETLDVQRIDVFDAAEYEWKEHSGTVTYSEIQQFKNSGDGEKFPLVAGLVENAIESHKNDIATAMFGDGTGNGGKNVNGLLNLVPDNPAAGIRGNINAATFSFWRSIQETATQVSTPFDTLRAKMRSAYNRASNGVGGEHPTFLVSGRVPFEGYEGLLTPNERFTDKKGPADGGFPNDTIKFKGAMYAYDEGCADTRQYQLNEKFIQLYVAKNVFMKLGKEQEPINGNWFSRKILTIAQFCVKQPRRLAVLTAIS